MKTPSEVDVRTAFEAFAPERVQHAPKGWGVLGALSPEERQEVLNMPPMQAKAEIKRLEREAEKARLKKLRR